eukprot:4301778-Pyramimonas_sp.AAC.1
MAPATPPCSFVSYFGDWCVSSSSFPLDNSPAVTSVPDVPSERLFSTVGLPAPPLELVPPAAGLRKPLCPPTQPGLTSARASPQ